MQKQETLSYEAQFKDATASFSPFAIQNTGIVQSQTLLKVDTYAVACVPYQFGMSRGVLAASFSKDEIAFFQRYKGSLAGLALAVQRPDARLPEKIFARCQLSAIGAMKGRDNVGLVVCEWKPIPPDLAKVLGEYLMLVEKLRVEYGDFKDKSVQVGAETAKRLGFNNYAVMTLGGEQHKLALFSLAVNRLEFLMPLRSPDMVPGTEASFSLFFLKYRFSVAGTIESSERLPTGIQRVRASIGFSPELVHLLDDYFASRR